MGILDLLDEAGKMQATSYQQFTAKVHEQHKNSYRLDVSALSCPRSCTHH